MNSLHLCKISLHASLLLVAVLTTNSLRLAPDTPSLIDRRTKQVQVHIHPKESKPEDSGLMELFPTGSSLPDCMHACGACSPCKRVMVSFECSIAESCPVVYRCICKGKYYHVPSN